MNSVYRLGAVLVVGAVVSAARGEAGPDWLQLGGPSRDFTVDTTGLADMWPEEGPERLWHRELGDGYSTILFDNGVLYTMHGTDESQSVVALDARTGRTMWERTYPSSYRGTQYGPGPHSTPLIRGDRLFTVTADAVFRCLEKRTGEILWKHDLATEFGAPIPHYGYGCSPIAYGNKVILVADRKRGPDGGGYYLGTPRAGDDETDRTGQSIMAFDQATGRVAWKSMDFAVDYSSPILINFRGEDQLVLFLRGQIVGVDPRDGGLLWNIECLPSPDENIASPVWNGEDLLFFSAAYSSGSRVLKLTKGDGKTIPRQLWYNRKLRILLGNAIRIGDYVYGSSGDFGPALFTCLNIKTGKAAWRKRGLKLSTCVLADGKLIILEDDGHLSLATVSPEGMTVHSKCKVAEYESWTAPTLVGTTLYVRDRKHIMALDVG